MKARRHVDGTAIAIVAVHVLIIIGWCAGLGPVN